MVNPSTGTTGSATPIRNRPSDSPLETYLQDAAWAKLNQSRGAFLGHHLHADTEAVEKGWDDAILAKADQIRKARAQKFWEQMVALVFPGEPEGPGASNLASGGVGAAPGPYDDESDT